jgi:hypothetical protein
MLEVNEMAADIAAINVSGSNGSTGGSSNSSFGHTIDNHHHHHQQQQQQQTLTHSMQQHSSSLSTTLTNCSDQAISITRVRISSNSQLYFVTKTTSDNTKEFIVEDSSVGSWELGGTRGLMLLSIVCLMIMLVSK